MSDQLDRTGSCLCGAVRFTAKNAAKALGACHCTMCRKWGGGPFLALECGTEVTFEGEENISLYDSSDWAERGFCRNCGTHLFYRLKENQLYMMSPGLFADDSELVFDHQVFIDEKPAYYSFANKTSDMTGAEVFEKYAAPSE
ncbi:GFA family protein [Exilibacterium tricleocarpae]|uniref:GFA family protein n=1 Tax=Exilibacterium tricleocarpae TaxID=2591008 RepID=A0A545U9Y6_9GAMM|nr:GFA family protein [Exilibacterium tricleocarpae]TQV86223.1 GFA family protein [Exilibacterium tricleocarpae]